MTAPLLRLISIDVGGTLGFVREPTITAMLATASKLPASEVRRILRVTLHVTPEVTDVLIDTVCEALRIDRVFFPKNYVPPPLQLYPWTLSAIKSLSEYATLVTLSNVSCLDSDVQALEASLGDYVTAHYPSCKLGYAKPDPRAFKAVAARHHISIATIIHIGDDWECDVLGALTVGARAVWISGGRTAPNNELHRNSNRLTIVKDLAEASEYLCTSAALSPMKLTYIDVLDRGV